MGRMNKERLQLDCVLARCHSVLLKVSWMVDKTVLLHF